MPGDLEDFLRRAAQRREQNANRQMPARPQPQRPSARPEYTDSRRERQTTPLEEEEEVFIAELVTDKPLGPTLGRPMPMETNPLPRTQPVESSAFPATTSVFAKRTADVFDHEVGNLDSSPGFAGIQPAQANVAPVIHPIIELFSNPKSIAQAIVMREILDRPTERWK